MEGDTRRPKARPVEEAVGELLDRSALQGERVVSIARVFFASSIAVRSWWVWHERGADADVLRGWVFFPAVAAIIAFSVVPWLSARRRPRISVLVHGSVAVDAVASFAALLTNPLWPWEGYLGLVNMPDLAILVLVTFAAGLRHSPSAAALGGVLCGISYGTLVAVDRAVSGDRVPVLGHHYVLYGMFVAGAAVLAVIVAVRTRRLAEQSARAAVQLDVTGRNLGGLLREHHDLRALFAAAKLNAERLARALPQATGAEAGAGVSGLVANLRDDLARLHGAIDDLKTRTYSELVTLEGPQPVEVAPLIDAALAGLAPRFPRVTLSATRPPAARASVSGGAPSLRRILFNLVLNACEGDGQRGAGRIEVRTAEAVRRGFLRIEVVDDGPGFPAEHLASPVTPGRTTKRDGNGMGLSMVAMLVRASGGELSVANRDGGGASVSFELPSASGRGEPAARGALP